MRRLASGWAVPGLTGRGCTLAAPVSARLAARGGRTPGAWSLVPDGNRAVPSPQVAAAVCAGVAAKLIPWSSSLPGVPSWGL